MAKKQTNTSVTATFTGIIYCYTSKTTNKKYIGQTVNEYKRRNKFLSDTLYCTNNKSGGKLSHFDYARFKYGIQDFQYEILETIQEKSKEELHNKLDLLEQYYIEKYDSFHNGYNSTSGGTYRKQVSEDTKKLLSQICIERYSNIENHPMFGKHHSQKTKDRISSSKKGQLTGGDNPNSREVLCYSKAGNFIQKFKSMQDALRFINNPKASHSAISRCCAGRCKSAYGYVWKYE